MTGKARRSYLARVLHFRLAVLAAATWAGLPSFFLHSTIFPDEKAPASSLRCPAADGHRCFRPNHSTRPGSDGPSTPDARGARHAPEPASESGTLPHSRPE